MDGALITYPFYPPESLLKGVLVNKEGRRYVAEDSYHSRTSDLHAATSRTSVAYLIVDDAIFGRPDYGGLRGGGCLGRASGRWKQGLGHAARVCPGGDTRSATTSTRARGEDPDFHKGSQVADPSAVAPPFAALDASLGSGRWTVLHAGRAGGSRWMERCCDEDGSDVIPGLYAIGGCASNIAQDGSGYSSGTCIGESTFFGRRAGGRAARA